MRALKVLLTALVAFLAVTAGLVVTAVVALAGVTVFLIARLFGKGSIRISGKGWSPQSTPRPKGDAIDVTATEVSVAAPALEEASRTDARVRE